MRYAGAKYHLTSRGNARQDIFLSDNDLARFVDQLASALEKDEVVLYAYVLMKNHWHGERIAAAVQRTEGTWKE